ncbi:MAG: GldG family protein, partial [Pseudomonadales bacterium]|nr:GldG family protein [Pseudomonadales bacterium]
MNNRSLFSATGLALTGLFLLVSIALISSFPRLRIDLTQDRLYTLADGTRNIVAGLQQPMQLLFFYSEEATADVPQLRAYGTRVQELLREMVIASNGKLNLQVIDPQPFSVEEDLATEYGVQAVPLSAGGEEIYFGLVVVDGVGDGASDGTTETETDTTAVADKVFQTMPLIRPDQETFLEYEFSRLISLVENPEPPVIGLITDLSIDGGFNPASGQATPAWAIMQSIRYVYDVRRIEPFADTIDEDIDILMLVHPQDLEQQTLYAIDQFVLRGGKAMVFVDPNADSQSQQNMAGVGNFQDLSSNLEPLLSAWGVNYDNQRVLADQDLALFVTMGQSQRPITHLGMLGIQRAQGGFADDIVTGGLEIMNLSSIGALSQAENASTRFDPLIQSSSNAMLMEAEFFRALTDPTILQDEFSPSGQRYTVAARISGPASTAFPQGRPVEEQTEEQAEEQTDNATDAPAPEAETAPEPETAAT